MSNKRKQNKEKKVRWVVITTIDVGGDSKREDSEDVRMDVDGGKVTMNIGKVTGPIIGHVIVRGDMVFR